MAARLAVKALIAYLGYEPPRTRRVGELLGALSRALGGEGG